MNKLKKIFLTAVATLTVVTVSAAGEEPAAESYRNNRHPLLQKDYIQLPLGTIRAEVDARPTDPYARRNDRPLG